MPQLKKMRAWIVTVDMGYGHQRVIMPIASFFEKEKVITANNYPGIPESDKKEWSKSLNSYYFVSRMKQKGFWGNLIFSLFDYYQKVLPFYPKRSLSKPTFQLKSTYNRIANGWGRHLIKTISQDSYPLVTTFFTTAFMAEYWNYPGPILVIVTDSDISRAWAPLNPNKSKIIYCASTQRSAERLQEYGVLEKNIVYTGFPLPNELTSNIKLIGKRIGRLDPQKKFIKKYPSVCHKYFPLSSKQQRTPIIITFVVGGAGTQADIGGELIKNFSSLIENDSVVFNLIAGTNHEAANYFEKSVYEAGMEKYLGNRISIRHFSDKQKYLDDFDKVLEQTDILWTKPSELSFYAALGIPLVMTPPVGSHEEKNRDWLLEIGSGINQPSTSYAAEWFLDLLKEGRFAEMAWQGFIEMERKGTENILKLIKKNSP